MLFLQQGVMKAQPTYNSAVGYQYGTPLAPTSAIVRAYSANMSVLCFNDLSQSGPELIMTDVTTNTPSNAISLTQMSYVTDVRIDPAAITPYLTSGVVENVGPNPYTSMDVLGSEYFVATGGNYEFVKKAFSDVTAPNCYEKNTLPIKIRANAAITASSFDYDVTQKNIIIDYYSVDTLNISTIPVCLD